MVPADGGHPEDPAGGDVEVVEGVSGPALSHDEADRRGQRHGREPGDEQFPAGDGGDVDRQHETGDQQHR